MLVTLAPRSKISLVPKIRFATLTMILTTFVWTEQCSVSLDVFGRFTPDRGVHSILFLHVQAYVRETHFGRCYASMDREDRDLT